MKHWALILCLLTLFTSQCLAHEMRPGYLEIKEITESAYSVLWKVPMRGELRLQP